LSIVRRAWPTEFFGYWLGLWGEATDEEQEEIFMSQFAMDRVSSSSRRLNVVVLLGGWSTEREVSLASGYAVIEALRERGHDVRELDPAVIDILSYPWAGVDAAFIALHGSFGEDGTVQSLLDSQRVTYSGSDAEASRLAMNKSKSKERFIEEGLPTPAYRTIKVREPLASVSEKAAAIGYPLVVKPNEQGSSIGVTIVRKPDELGEAILGALRYDPLVLLESYVPGRELTVAVLEHRPLPAIEVTTSRLFYDYRAKYHDDGTGYVFDTELPAAVVRHVESIAVSAVRALGCSGVTRVDLRVDDQHRPWLLEVNTIPGFTDHSLVPKAAARAGLDFGELCEQLLVSKMEAASQSVGSRAA
jgi:D-alanine-D-alanine ligase